MRLPEREEPVEFLTGTEQDIIKSFGWNVLASEKTLYERYLQVSARRSFSDIKEFRELLREMEARGLLSSEKHQGQRFYRIMVVLDGLFRTAHPETPLDEIHLAIGSRKAEPEIRHYEGKRVDGHVVLRSEYIGRQIQRALEAWMVREKGKISKAAINEHMMNMWHALARSEVDLLNYVRNEVPGIAADVRGILRSSGPDVFLLGLRLADAATRKYR